MDLSFIQKDKTNVECYAMRRNKEFTTNSIEGIEISSCISYYQQIENVMNLSVYILFFIIGNQTDDNDGIAVLIKTTSNEYFDVAVNLYL